MEIVKDKTDYSEQVRLSPLKDGRWLVTVHKAKTIGADSWRPTEISWSSIGFVTPDKAQAFARALCYAVCIAEELDAKYA